MTNNFKTDSCRAFLFFLGGRPIYRQKLFSKSEIFCSPDAETNILGSQRTIQTPSGSYCAKEFFSKNKITQKPDVILVKADATGRNLPSNLAAFGCPRVLLVGDTHHMGAPIQKLLAYARQENFDRIIFDHTRHHARWFFEAGLKNIHWIPALDFTYNPRTPAPIPSRQFSFVGQAGKFHPYRCQVIESLHKSGLPLETLRGTPAEAADIYSDSVITLNVSLNGDLNLRVFEALAAGGFLLTDKLSASSGLELLFKPGEDIEVWSNIEELIEKAKYYLKHPKAAELIRQKGQQKLVEHHHPDIKICEFFELVFEGKENPLYSLDSEKTKARTIIPGVDLSPGLEAYEFLQELHRLKPPLEVWAGKEAFGEASSFFADLPRTVISNTGGSILFLEGSENEMEATLDKFEGKWVVAPQNLSTQLQTWGFVEIAGGVFQFTYQANRSLKLLQHFDDETALEKLPGILEECTQAFQALLVADKALDLELRDIYQKALQRALFLDRNCLSALIQLADLCLRAGAEEDAAILLNEAHRVQALPQDINKLREELEVDYQNSEKFANYKEAVTGGNVPSPDKKYSILVVTNLFPPQEMGGYGRKIWEFSNGLNQRGHRIKILTGDAPYLQKKPDAGEPDLEPLVERTLSLQGEWKNGKTQQLGDLNFLRKTAQANKEKVLAAATVFHPDIVLLGNFDFLGVKILRGLIAENIPVIHSLGNQTPGYHPEDSIESTKYAIAPASDWLGKNLLQSGYKVSKLITVYPGARVDRFFKQFLPDIRQLRIAFAGLVMPYKGAHVLMDALNILNHSGIEFEADFAGDSTDTDYVQTLKEFALNNNMGEKVRFNGFLDRQGLEGLFARCNVLVFPTQVPEAFGISQVEAMASGLIVITSGTGGTQEVIRNGIDGLVFEMGNPLSLAQNLATLATNKEIRDRLQIASQKRALEFSVIKSVLRIEQVVSEMVSSNENKSNLQVSIKLNENKNNYLLITTAHKKKDFYVRQKDYRLSIRNALKYKKYFSRIFILECLEKEGIEYLKIDPKINIIYSECQNPYINYGLNELLHIEHFLNQHQEIKPDDSIVKMTGRYMLQNDNLLKLLPLDFDIVAKKDNDIWGSDFTGDSKGVHTFYMMFKKRIIREIVNKVDFKDDADYLKDYCLEWIIKEYMLSNSKSKFYEGIMGIITNFNLNKGKLLT